MEPQITNSHYGALTSTLSSSPTSVDEHREDSTTTRNAHSSKRFSSIHFSDEVVGGQSSMSNRRRSADSDEITPIRRADGQSDRTYNTTNQESNRAIQPAKPVAASAAATDAEEQHSWFRRMVDKYGSISLDNKGSVARDHLALERTFLAWLRTSLAFASIGIAVTQLFRLNTSIQGRTRSSAVPFAQPQSLPLSPLLGHGLPAELVPMLQQLAYATAQAIPAPAPTNTLLDQLLLMPSMYMGIETSVHQQEFDEHAAARLRRVGKPLGATFIGISIIVLLVGFHRYFEAQYWIQRGKFPASRGSVAFIGFIAGALIVASLVVILVVAPVSYEKR